MRAIRLFVFLLLISASFGAECGKGGCGGDPEDPPADDTDGGDPGPEPEPDDITEADALTAFCKASQLPAPRRYHQMEYFHLETPMALLDEGKRTYYVERGFLMYGGLDPDDHTTYDDLWLFDLTNGATINSCAWRLLSESATTTDGIFGGTMRYVTSTSTMMLVAGFSANGSTQKAQDTVYELDLGDDTFHVLSSGEIGENTFEFTRNSAAECQDTTTRCVALEVVAGENTCQSFALTTAAVDLCSSSYTYDDVEECPSPSDGSYQVQYPLSRYKPACASDPICTGGDPQERFTEVAPGVAQFGAVYDPISERVTLHGGTTGCYGPDCANWRDLYLATEDESLDPEFLGYDELYGVNLPYAFEFDATGALVGNTRTDLTDWLDYGGGRIGYSCEEAALSTYGVQRSSGAFVGATWSRTSRSWSYSGEQLEFLFGGTMHQVVPPASHHLTEIALTSIVLDAPGGKTHTCAGVVLEADSSLGFGYIPAEDCGIADATEGIVPEGINAVSYVYHAATGAYEKLPLDGKIDSRYAVAMTSLSASSVLAVGGKLGGHSDGIAEAYRIVPASGAVSRLETGDMPRRYGAGTVYDPVEGVAYIWGGSDSDDRVWKYHSNHRTRNLDASLVLAPMDIKYEYRSGDWWSSASVSAVLDVDASKSFLDEVYVYLGSEEAGDFSRAKITVTYGRDGQQFDLLEETGGVGTMQAACTFDRSACPGSSRAESR